MDAAAASHCCWHMHALQGLLTEDSEIHRHERSKAVGAAGHHYRLPSSLSAMSHLSRLAVLDCRSSGNVPAGSEGKVPRWHVNLPSGLRQLHVEGASKLLGLLLGAVLPADGGPNTSLTSLRLSNTQQVRPCHGT